MKHSSEFASLTIGKMEYWNNGKQQEQSFISFGIHYSSIPWKWHKPGTIKEFLISTNCRFSRCLIYFDL
jgi:hypothetical protein